MSIDDLLIEMKQLKLKETKWKNNFNSKSVELNQDNYTKSEVIKLLNKYEDELFEKFMYYVKLWNNMNQFKINSNQYTGECF